jgi:Uma2 family endonuclease
MNADVTLMTVDEFRELPEGGEFEYELHYGEVFSYRRPKLGVWSLRHHLHALLQAKCPRYESLMVFPYRALSEYDLRVADVGLVSRGRYIDTDPDDNLRGAPDLTIEAKSPLLDRSKLAETVTMSLTSGAIECWIIDVQQKLVAVYRRDHPVALYGSGDSVPLTAFDSDALPVDDIFNESSHR